MRQNVFASPAVKAIFGVLAPLGLVTLVLAAPRTWHVAARHPQRAPPPAPPDRRARRAAGDPGALAAAGATC
jgi:hypothetical protein